MKELTQKGYLGKWIQQNVMERQPKRRFELNLEGSLAIVLVDDRGWNKEKSLLLFVWRGRLKWRGMYKRGKRFLRKDFDTLYYLGFVFKEITFGGFNVGYVRIALRGRISSRSVEMIFGSDLKCLPTRQLNNQSSIYFELILYKCMHWT